MAFRKARVEWFRPVAKSVEAAWQFVSVDEAEIDVFTLQREDLLD